MVYNDDIFFTKGEIKALKTEVFAKYLTWDLPGHNPIAGTKKGVIKC